MSMIKPKEQMIRIGSEDKSSPSFPASIFQVVIVLRVTHTNYSNH